jgi:hypothetical protein
MGAMSDFWNNVVGTAPAAGSTNDTSAPGDPPSVQLVDGALPPEPPPAHDDPAVGQNKAVDPNDKGAGLIFQGDIQDPLHIRPKGGYLDVPDLKGVKPSGDPLQYSKDGDTQDSSGPPANKPSPGPGYRWDSGLHRWLQVPSPGPGYVWDPTMQNWRKGPDATSCPVTPTPPAAADPAEGLGDFDIPDSDTRTA